MIIAGTEENKAVATELDKAITLIIRIIESVLELKPEYILFLNSIIIPPEVPISAKQHPNNHRAVLISKKKRRSQLSSYVFEGKG